MDRTLWEHNRCKAYTLSGSQASWPIGILESSLYPAIALTEGVPDFLSAFHLALAFGVDALLAPVCMSGARVSIPGAAWGYGDRRSVYLQRAGDVRRTASEGSELFTQDQWRELPGECEAD
jgi:hypothetical protein